MTTRPRTIRQISDHLCAESARLHQAISSLPDNYMDTGRQALTNQLVAVRHTLGHIHGTDPDPIVTSWWQRKHPADWRDDARRTRHAERLYIHVHQLVLATGHHHSIPGLAHDVGKPVSTVYFLLGNPARGRWRTLEPLVLHLGGHRDTLWAIWEQAFRRPRKTTPAPNFGRSAWTPRPL